jgi:hypothetical protein
MIFVEQVLQKMAFSNRGTHEWTVRRSLWYRSWWLFHAAKAMFFRTSLPFMLAMFGWFAIQSYQAYADGADWKGFFATASTFIAGAFFLQKYRNEETRIAVDSFREFNRRYDELEPKLRAAMRHGVSTIDGTSHDLYSKYLNLCAEEYLHFKKGYVSLSVWKAWYTGMLKQMHGDPLRVFWQVEQTSGSYYGLEDALKVIEHVEDTERTNSAVETTDRENAERAVDLTCS